MFKLSCPKCGSSRIHRGYSQAPLYKRAFGWQNLLCNGCNLLFTSFAWPGTIQSQSRRKRKAREDSARQQETQSVLREATESVTPAGLRQALRREAAELPPFALSAVAQVDVAAHTPRMVRPEVAAGDSGELPEPIISRQPEPSVKLPVKAATRAKRAARPTDEVAQTPSEAPAEPHKWDYARFAIYYAKLYLKVKTGARKTSHSMEVKFRWRNWWHRQRMQKQ